jgi:hypothetical protein
LAGQELNGEVEKISDRYRDLAGYLAELPLRDRQVVWRGFLCGRPDSKDLIKALADQSPGAPPPAAEAIVRCYATLEDIAKIMSSQPWLWRGWIASGVLNAVAADPGVGKTRFAMDLARRLWFGLPWPDGLVNELPKGTRTLWVQGDRNFAEMLQAANDFGLPDEAVVLGSSPDDPTGSLDLDDPATLAALGGRMEAAAVRLAILDTVGMTTSRNLCRPEEARAFFAPVMELAGKTGVPILGLTHLSKDKEALGRRIVEKARVVIKMTQPDPEGQRDRRCLIVDKTAIQKPLPLGVTMKDAGNDYDFDPPKEPEAFPRRRGPAPIKLEECKGWLKKLLTPNPVRVTDVRRDAEKAGYSADVLYRARNALKAEELKLDHRLWWKLPPVGDSNVGQSNNSDNSDKLP